VTHLFWTVHGENSSLYDADHTITSLSQTENTPSIDMPNLTDLLLLQMNSLGSNLVPLLAVIETIHLCLEADGGAATTGAVTGAAIGAVIGDTIGKEGVALVAS